MPTGTITISQYTANPPIQVDVNSSLEVRGWYSRDMISIDGVTPIFGNSTDGEQGPYFSTTPTLNVSGNVVVPAHDVQITVGANPTANYFEGLWVDGAFVMLLMPNTQGATGWQIPSVYGNPIAYDEIATYNRARRLVYAPNTYLTADEVIQEILRLSGNFDYMAVGVNGIGQASFPPVVASAPIVLMENDPRVGSYFNILAYGAATTNTAAQNAVFIAAAVTAAAAASAGIYIPHGTFPTNSVTISVPIQFAPGGSILRPATGQAITITKAITADTSQHFDNALSGQGSILLSGNNFLSDVHTSWWGTTGSAVQAAHDAGAPCPIVMPSGTITFSTATTETLSLTRPGLILRGQGGHAAAVGVKQTILDFNACGNNSNGIHASAKGIELKDFYIDSSQTNGIVNGGAAIWLDTCTSVLVDNVYGTWYRGPTGVGLLSGSLTDGAKASILVTVRGGEFGVNGGTSYVAGLGCTSTTFLNAYSIGGNPGYHLLSARYSGLLNCGCDSGDGYAYVIDACETVTLIACGAESMGKGRVKIMATCQSITDIDGRGIANNQSSDSTIGSFWEVAAGSNFNLRLVGGFDDRVFAAPIASIHVGAGNLWTIIEGRNDTSMPSGLSGDSTWSSLYRTEIGGTYDYKPNLTGDTPAGAITMAAREVATGGAPAITATQGTDATPTNTETYIAELFIPVNTTITGVAILNGSAVAGNVKAGLATNAGIAIAGAQTASTAQSGTNAYQRIPFAAPYAAIGPATYYLQVQFNTNTTPRYRAHSVGNFGTTLQVAQTFGTLTNFSPPTTFAADRGPIASLY